MTECITSEDILQIDLNVRLHAFTDAPEQVLSGRIKAISRDTIEIELTDEPAAGSHLPGQGMPVELSLPGTGCLYRTACSFLEVGSAPHTWLLEKPFLLTREQHRNYVRVPVLLPVHVKTQNIYGTFNDARETISLNISGSGLCFTLPHPLPIPATISLTIDDLPGMSHFPILADTVRCAIAPTQTGSVYHIGVTFDKYLSARTRTSLIRAITALQQAALTKGVGIR